MKRHETDVCLFAFGHPNVGGGHLPLPEFDRQRSLTLCRQGVTLRIRLVKVLLREESIG